MADNKTVKITFEIDGLEQSVSSIDDAKAALKKLETQSTKTEKSIEGASDELKNMGDSAKDAGEAGQGAVAVLDEATGGLASRVRNVGVGLKQMGVSAKASFKAGIAGANGMKKALIATGIGALVVALGLIIAYWDDIKALVSGVSVESKKLLKSTEDTRDAAQEQLEATSSTENSLKLAGKTEREIRDLKIQQTNEVIAATEMILEQQRQQKKAQIEAAERNQKIAAGIIGFLSLPITMLLGAVDALTYGLSLVSGIDATSLAEDFTMGAASLIFDPEDVATEGDAVLEETEKQLTKLKNQRDGFKLANKKDDASAAEEAKTKKDEADLAAQEAEKTRIQELADLKATIRDAEANTVAELRAKELEDLDLFYEELILKAEEQGLATEELERSKQEKLKALKDKAAKEDSDRIAAQKKKDKDAKDNELKIEKAVQDGKIDMTKQTLTTAASLLDEGSAAGKAAAIAAATINTYQGITAELATKTVTPFEIGLKIANIATIAAIGFKSVKDIVSTPVPGGGGGGGGGGQAPAVPSAPAYDPASALDAAADASNSNNEITMDQNAGSTGSVIRAFVVSDDMTTQQEADAKINDLARL
jgi:hypothetical protein